MTNEETIKRLKQVQAEFNENWVDYGGVNQAFENAYKALEERSQGEQIRLDLAKRVIAKFEGYLDEDMITRIQIALEKENEAQMQKDGMLELVETIDKAILPLGYEVITGHEDEEDGTFNLTLIKREDDEDGDKTE